jgi:hypothetical protein
LFWEGTKLEDSYITFFYETKKKRMQVAHVVGMLQGINLKYAFVVADLEIILCYLHLD